VAVLAEDRPAVWRTRQRPLLGTFVEIGAGAGEGSDVDLDAAVTDAFEAVRAVHGLLSFHDPNSDLSRLNGARGAETELHPISLRVLRLSRAMTLASCGLFNCTVGGALVRRGILPDHGDGPMLDAGEAEDIEISASGARLRRPVRVTLDGIAKGFAVDMAVRRLKRCGVQEGFVNAGGDLRAFGVLVLPVARRELDGCLTSLGGLSGAALATSRAGSKPDERFPAWITAAGRAPSQPGVHSVMARAAWRADALTKVAALAVEAERAATVERLGGRLVEAAAS